MAQCWCIETKHRLRRQWRPCSCDVRDWRWKHRSARTYVAVANHVGSGLLAAFGKVDLLPREAPGRLSGRWIDVPGGIDIFSAYFQDAAGWNQTNVALARKLCVVTSTVGLWILALDSSTEPEEFYRK